MQNKDNVEALEQQLAELSPSPLPETLRSRLEQTMQSWEQHIPAKEKLVSFENDQARKPSQFTIWSTAAAITLMAIVGTVFINSGNNKLGETTPTVQDPHWVDSVSTPQPFNHQLTNASHEGITYAGEKPYKVFRIEYIEDVEQTDVHGNKTITKEPAVDLILVPIDIH